jgi:hypothetical protein
MLVILEAKLPKKDGFSLIDSFLKMGNSTRPQDVLLIGSSPLSQAQKVKYPELAFLQKPCGKEDATKKIKEIISSMQQDSPDVLLLNPLAEGTIDILKKITGADVFKESVSVRKPNQPSGDISAAIPLNSRVFTGSFAISFKKQVYLKIVSKILGENNYCSRPTNGK